MNARIYQFVFDPAIDLDEAECILHTAIIAAEGLFGEALVRVEAGYRRDDVDRSLYVDGTHEVGQAVVRIFTSLIIKDLGSTTFTVSAAPRGQPAEALAFVT